MDFIKSLIFKYLSRNTTENADIAFSVFEKNRDIYSRKNAVGHVTTSAVILDSSLQNILMIYHKGLNRWLMPGGHVDQGEYPIHAVMREVAEETGLTWLQSLNTDFIDINIHPIPDSPKKREPAHWHIDLRYIFSSPKHQKVKIAENEINEYKWTALAQVPLLSPTYLPLMEKIQIEIRKEKERRNRFGYAFG